MYLPDLCRTVTENIIQELEAGTPVWTCPWKSGAQGSFIPHNAITGRPYSGTNISILWGQAIKLGYRRHAWLTYKQAHAVGAHVKQGETGTVLKTFTVFHVSQVDGLPEPSPIAEPPPEARHEAAYAFIEGTKAEIRHEGDMAMYVRDEDVIRLPPRPMFKGDEYYLAAATHELVHWSGAEHRLNRELDNLLGTEGYRAEELIADLGSAFLCAHLGIEGNLQHASHIDDWLAPVTSEAIYTAASNASHAVDY